MTRRLLTLAVGLAAAVLGSNVQSNVRAQAPAPPTFRAGADSVTVDVSVRQRGRPVTGLTAADFELIDNGAPQTIADLSFERLPVDVTIALDVSDSVTGPVVEQLRRAVRQLETDLTPRDRIRLVTFNLRISRLLDFGPGGATTDAAFAKIQPFGGTAVFDTIAVLLAAPAPPDRRHLVVVFTDGEDSNSVSEPNSVLEVARRTTPTLSVVLSRLGTAGMAPQTRGAAAREQLYSQLARETGGIVESLGPTANLSSSFRRMLEEFRSSYVLHFVPARAGGGASFRPLEVKVKRPGVEVRARRGYTLK
jgi:Ca-activated chloride channel family protein